MPVCDACLAEGGVHVESFITTSTIICGGLHCHCPNINSFCRRQHCPYGQRVTMNQSEAFEPKGLPQGLQP